MGLQVRRRTSTSEPEGKRGACGPSALELGGGGSSQDVCLLALCSALKVWKKPSTVCSLSPMN